MLNRFIVILFFLIPGLTWSQTSRVDSIPPSIDASLAMDTTADYEELLSDLDLFLDSLLAPRSYLLMNVSLGQGYFSYINKSSGRVRQLKQATFTPTLGYYGKSGLGVTVNGYTVKDSQRVTLYQFSLSPSYDYLKDRRLALGVSYTRYFIQDSLRFYVSPLQNEVNAYFLWRKSWLQPGISASVGWGSRTKYTSQLDFIELLDVRGLVVNSEHESISDFSVSASVRHDFYWLHIFSEKDHIRLSPLLSFSSGSQRFGLNSSTGTYAPVTGNLLYRSGNVSLDNNMRFQPLSLTMNLRSDYNFGKFYIQPQILLDYYFPAKENNFNAFFMVNVGVLL
jgi:hypothetical protein